MVTILTSPVNTRTQLLIQYYRSPRRLVRLLINWFARDKSVKFGGHAAVTRSLIEGFINTKNEYNYNPPVKDIFPDCVVLSDIESLKSAIQMKREGKIRTLLAGPNIVTLPNEAHAVITKSEIDICIVPSLWVKKLYLTCCPALEGRLEVWAAGVNTNSWRPAINHAINERPSRILIYIKGSQNSEAAYPIIQKLKGANFSVMTVEYGAYDQGNYKELLNWANLMIVLGGTESQGIAMVEAWSMNVPTLVKATSFWCSPEGKHFPASAAPYLTELTGKFFNNEDELFSILQDWAEKKICFSPRCWTIKNLSDEICALNLMRLINDKSK